MNLLVAAKKKFNFFLKLSVGEKLLVGMLIFLPLERLLTVDISYYTVKVSYLLALALVIFFGLRIFCGREKITLEWNELILLLFIAFSFMSVCWSLDRGRSIIVSSLYLFMALIFYIVKRMVKLAKREFYLDVIWMMGVLTSLFALWQFVADGIGLSQSFSFLRNAYIKDVFGFPRVQSTFLEPLYFANFLLFPLLITFYRIVRRPQIVYFLGLFLMTMALFFTVSRGGIIAFAFGTLAFLVIQFCQYRKHWRRGLLILLVIVLAIGAVLGMIRLVSKGGVYFFLRHTSDNEVVDAIKTKKISPKVKLYDRSFTIPVALREITEHKMGLGAGAFGALSDFAQIRAAGRYQIVNNLYLEVLVENGIIGALLFAVFLLLIFISSFDLLRRRDLRGIALILGIAAIFIQYISFSNLNILYLWVFLALCLSCSRQPKVIGK